jgi:hypothetical protein
VADPLGGSWYVEALTDMDVRAPPGRPSAPQLGTIKLTAAARREADADQRLREVAGEVIGIWTKTNRAKSRAARRHVRKSAGSDGEH